MVQYTLIEHSKYTLIEHSSNKIFALVLFILEHNTSIMGSMKSIISKEIPKSILGRGKSILLLFSPIYLSGNSIFLPVRLRSKFCSKFQSFAQSQAILS